MEKKIQAKVKDFTASMYALDFKKLVQYYFYPPDVQEFTTNMLWLAEHMAPFGETAGLLNLFPNVHSLEQLKTLSQADFVGTFMGRMIQKIPAKKMQEMLDSIQITEIEREDNIAAVTYTFDNVFEENGEVMESHLDLILEDGTWYFKFKSGMQNFFNVYHEQIAIFYERKKKDRLDLLESSQFNELEPFKVMGYRNLEGRTVIEPRFREAKDFSEGLAAVKVFSKYGYLDQTGTFVIEPQFDRAEEFQNGIARVARRTEDWEWEYGLVDKNGAWILPYTYDKIDEFCEGLAVVKQGEKYGYLNPKGEVVVEIAYDSAEDFEDGQAAISYETGEEIKYMILNTKGEIVDSY